MDFYDPEVPTWQTLLVENKQTRSWSPCIKLLRIAVAVARSPCVVGFDRKPVSQAPTVSQVQRAAEMSEARVAKPERDTGHGDQFCQVYPMFRRSSANLFPPGVEGRCYHG